MPSYRTLAIVIKRRNQGESDRVLTLFSREFGRLTAIAKGARKVKSKFAGSIELFSESDFILTSGKTFEIVGDVNVVRHHLSDCTQVELVKLAHFFAEVTIHATVEKEPSPKLYEVLANSLLFLGKLDVRLVTVYFASHILTISGAQPELGTCLSCGKKPTNEIRFSHTAGGIFCKECKPVIESLMPVDKDTVKLWRFVSTATEGELERLKIDNDDLLKQTTQLALDFLCNITGKNYCTVNGLDLTSSHLSSMI